MSESITLALLNHKGGVGKTSSSVNLAHALALRGKKVLVIDNDTQGNTSSIFCPNIDKSMYHLLHAGLDADAELVEQCIYRTVYDNVFCLPNESKTSTLEMELFLKYKEATTYLRKSLRQYIKENFDVCIIDSPPNMGIFVMQALVCADSVIVPIACGSRFSLEGLRDALDHIKLLQARLNKDLFFLRILINRSQMRNAKHKVAISTINKTYGEDMVFNTVIPDNEAFESAEAGFRTVIREASNSAGAKAFRKLADEVIEILELSGTSRQEDLLFD